MIGFEKRTITPGDGLPANGKVIPPQSDLKVGWVDLVAFSRDDAVQLRLLGPAWLYGHIGAELGDAALPGPVEDSYPTDIQSRWLRASTDGQTARTKHRVGTTTQFGDGRRHPETLTLDDFPMRFQVWQEGGVMVVRKAEALIDAYDSRMAYRHEPIQITDLWTALVAGWNP
jgi:hypothetical protein